MCSLLINEIPCVLLGGRGEGTNFYWLSLLLCVFIIAKVFVVLFVVVFVARAGALIRSSLWISTWIVRGHPFREFESTHRNVCKGSLQKTRGEVCKVSKKVWRCIAVLLKLDSPIFYTFLWWALHKTIRSNGPRSALNTEEPNRETMHFSHSIYVVSELKKQSFGLFLQIEIQTKKRLNQDGGRGRLDLPGWIR